MSQRRRDALRISGIRQKQGDQFWPEAQIDRHGQYGDQRDGDHLEAEHALYLFPVALPVVLRAEDARPGQSAEKGQLKDEEQLIGNGDARHLFRTDAPHHDVVQQTDEARNALLRHDGQHHPQDPAVKGPVAHVTFHQHDCSSSFPA